MPKLSDTQAILLSSAAQHDDRNLRPLPASLIPGGGVAKAIAALVKAGYVEQRDTDTFATDAGLAAIGIEGGAPTEEAPAAPTVVTPRVTKAGAVVALLQRAQGATLPELIAATGWLPHTTRAALTGLRKKGHTVEKTKRDGATCYRIVSAA